MSTVWELPGFSPRVIAAVTEAAGGVGHATLELAIVVDSDDPETVARIERAALLQGVRLRRLEPAPAE